MSEPQRDAPLVYVLTLNWNGKRWLGECLSSVLELDYPNFEVVVIDNGSTDGSVEFVRENYPVAQVVENGQNLGYARGFNAGLEYGYAHGADYFLIMNNDAVIDPGALSALVETAQSQPRAGFVSGKVYWYDRPRVLQTVGKVEGPDRLSGIDLGVDEEDNGQYDAVQERAFLDDIFTLVPRQLYEETGGYDPQFFLQCEELDWQLRARKSGWKLYYTPDAKLWHYGSRSMGGQGSPISEYFFVRNHLVVMAKHGGPRRFARLWLRIGWDRSMSVLRGVVGSIVGRKPWMRSRVAAWLGWVAGTLWLAHRRPATGVPWPIRVLGRTAKRR